MLLKSTQLISFGLVLQKDFLAERIFKKILHSYGTYRFYSQFVTLTCFSCGVAVLECRSLSTCVVSVDYGRGTPASPPHTVISIKKLKGGN